MGIEKVIKAKQEDEKAQGKNFFKNFDPKNISKNKKTVIIAGSIGALIVSATVFHFLMSSPHVEIKQGLTKQDVKQLVNNTLQPIVQNQQQMQQELQQLAKQNSTNSSASLPRNQGNSSTQTSNTSNTYNNSTSSPKSTNIPHSTGIPPTASKPSNTQPQEINLPPLGEMTTSMPRSTSPSKEITSLPPNNNYQSLSALSQQQPPQIKMHVKTMPQEKKRELSNNTIIGNSSSNQSEKKRHKYVYIPAGSIAEGQLMYGFVAPQSGVLPPVVIKIVRPVWTANNWYEPFQECLIVAKAQFDPSQVLAVVGGEDSTLSCVLPNGKVVQKQVDVAIGDRATKDGLAQVGLTGKEKWLTGKQMAEIMSMYGIAGFAQGIQNAQVQQSMTTAGTTLSAITNEGLYSAMGGVNQALQGFLNFWLQQFQNVKPVIQVPPKKVFIVFIKGVNTGIKQNEMF